MSSKKQQITYLIMIYSLIVIAISSVNIHYFNLSNIHIQGNTTEPRNSIGNTTIRNGTGNTTACNIYDIHQVSYNYSIGHIVLAIITILGCMCVQTSKKEFNVEECYTIPGEYWIVVSTLSIMGVLTIITAEAGSKFEDPYYKPIELFQATGCDPLQLGIIYASMFITGLPAMLFVIVLGLFIIASIICWSGYAIVSWLRTFTCCANLCRDYEAACETTVKEENNQPRPINISYSSSARTKHIGQPQSLNAIWTGNTIRYSEL